MTATSAGDRVSLSHPHPPKRLKKPTVDRNTTCRLFHACCESTISNLQRKEAGVHCSLGGKFREQFWRPGMEQTLHAKMVVRTFTNHSAAYISDVLDYALLAVLDIGDQLMQFSPSIWRKRPRNSLRVQWLAEAEGEAQVRFMIDSHNSVAKNGESRKGPCNTCQRCISNTDLASDHGHVRGVDHGRIGS
jgi:hypothetical protein